MADSDNDINDPPHFTCIWTIENVYFACYDGSPTFTVNEMGMSQWRLWIDAKNSDFIELEIRRLKDDGPNAIEIKFELSFLGIDGLPLINKTNFKKFEVDDIFEFKEFADKHEVFCQRRKEFLPKDELTIRCRMWRTGTEIERPDLCFARSRLRLERHSFIWAIREFSILEGNEMRKILLKMNSTTQWTFYLFETRHHKEECISIITEYSGDSTRYNSCTIKISLLDFEGKVVHSLEGWKDFQEEREDFPFFESFIEKSRLKKDEASLLPNDVMTLRCEIEMQYIYDSGVIENYRHFNWKSCRVVTTNEGEVLHLDQDGTSNVTTSFTEAMKSLQEEGTLSDVSLRTDSKSFPAHKCILSARSPVFKAMFTMKKKTSKCVDIPDVDEDTLRQLLSFIYTDKIGELHWERAKDLYRAADKYELLDLKRRCVNILKSRLYWCSEVCEVLGLADKYQDPELLGAAEDFIMQEGEEFFSDDSWQSFKEENSKLALDIMERILCNIKRYR